MGFYSVCPGTQEYAIGSPLFKKITLRLENGKIFIIHAPQNKTENVYIQSALLNGGAYNKNYLKHADIMKGGTLQFNMSNQPNVKRGVVKEAAPFSFSK